jgi:hypothetical protein
MRVFLWKQKNERKIMPIQFRWGTIVVLSTLVMLASTLCFAASKIMWGTNGVAITQIDGSDASCPQIISDGDGGTIIAWNDDRDGWLTGIYAQKVDSNGNIKWMKKGVQVRSLKDSHASSQQLVSDGTGGVIITWEDERDSEEEMYPNIYAQRIDSNESVKWTKNGIAVCNVKGHYAQSPQIISDGQGGAIISWYDERNGGIYAQRLGPDGNPLWTANGVPVWNVSLASEPAMVSDGAGGAIITWSGADSIYANRIDPNGSGQWPTKGSTSGVAVRANQVGEAKLPQIASDGAGGAVISWNDCRNSSFGYCSIYANKVNSAGKTLWPTPGSTSGTQVCNNNFIEVLERYPLISDGSGGAIITWSTWSKKCSEDSGIYAQRIDFNGNTKRTPNGIVVRTPLGSVALSPQLTTDGSDGAIITWTDYRRKGLISSYQDIYAQRVTYGGDTTWTSNGVVVRGTEPCINNAGSPQITTDGAGGAIITWHDDRYVDTFFNEYSQIYAQRIAVDPLPTKPIKTSQLYRENEDSEQL